MSLRKILPTTVLKVLAIRQYACGLSNLNCRLGRCFCFEVSAIHPHPCIWQNSAQKIRTHILREHALIKVYFYFKFFIFTFCEYISAKKLGKLFGYGKSKTRISLSSGYIGGVEFVKNP